MADGKRDPWRDEHDPVAERQSRQREAATPPRKGQSLEDKLAKFKPSLVKRARKRRVRDAGQLTWEVLGDASLGDQYDIYTVSLQNNKYWCSCYQHYYGDVRSKRICSHILAVIIYRHERREKKNGQAVDTNRPPLPGRGGTLV